MIKTLYKKFQSWSEKCNGDKNMKYKIEFEIDGPEDFYKRHDCERYCPFATTYERDSELGTTFTECTLNYCPFEKLTSWKISEINS